MSDTKPVFLVRRAKKQSGQSDAVLWCSDDYEAANATLDYLLLKSGRKFKDYFKAVATNFPVVNELPPEGEISFTFCDYYQLGDDGMTWGQIPGVTLPPHPGEKVAEGADTTVDDGVNTRTGEIIDHEALDIAMNGGETPDPDLKVDEDDDDKTEYSVAEMTFSRRLLSQYIVDKTAHHIKHKQRVQVIALALDTDNHHVQNLLLATRNFQQLENLSTADLCKFTNAYKTVFKKEKRYELGLLIQFIKLWLETEHMDRGILVREWAAGNRINKVSVHETKSEENVATPATRYKRSVSQSVYNLNVESCIARLYPDAEPGKIKVEQLKAAKEVIESRDEVQSKVITVLSKISDILQYDSLSVFGVTRAIDWNENLFEGPIFIREQARNWLSANGIYENGKKSGGYPEWEEDARAARHVAQSTEEIDRQLAAERGEFVEGISDPNDQKWVKGNAAVLSKSEDTTQSGESDAGAGEEAVAVEKTAAEILATNAPSLADHADGEVNQKSDTDIQISNSVNHSKPAVQQNEPEAQQDEPAPEQVWPEYFEPGRYEGVPNDVYHAANGISSTMVKDARVSLMYYEARHVSKTIKKERSPILDMGNLVHALALQPEILDEEFSIEPEIPEGAFTTTATIRTFIDEYNNSLPVLLSADDIKRFIEEHNASLPAQIPLGGDINETGQSYMSLPVEFQRIEEGQKQTAAAMKACIKEYNATLPAQMKTSGSRDVLLEQLAIINPDLVAQEAQKPAPLKVSGTKADLIQAVKTVKPDAVFADEILDAWRENPGEKILVTHQQYTTALAIQSALYAHPEAGALLTNPTRAVEVSYFGIDEETGLEIRTRPDVEITYEGLRIGFDLKTISMWDVKENQLKSRLHREITMRDYHLSAGMYCENASLDKFAWIFVNKDEDYHWVAVVWAPASLLELGTLEYRQTMRAIANAMDTGEWPAPITEDYTDELNDFDLRRLDALREMA